MAYSDPQTVTVNAVAQVLPRTGQGPSSGTFTKDDGTFVLKFNHQVTNANRIRSTARIDAKKIAADPLVSAANAEYGMSIYITTDRPKFGYTIAEAKQIFDGFLAYMSASSGANITKLLGQEV